MCTKKNVLWLFLPGIDGSNNISACITIHYSFFHYSGRTPLSVRFERNNLLDEGDSDGALSAPELPIARKHRGW